MRPSLVLVRIGCTLLLALAACGTSSVEEEMVDCAKITDVDTFVVGLEKMGKSGMLDFRLMSMTPVPPARGDNTWIVQINTMTSGVVGAPLEGATLQVTPIMPAPHNHVSPVTVEITPLPDPGQYQLAPVNTWMQGVWETTIRATTSTETDSAMYRFCVP